MTTFRTLFKTLVSVKLVMVVCMVLVFAAAGFSAGISGDAAEKAPGKAKAGVSKGASVKKGLVNINTAGVEQLVRLPRVGEKIAQRIIDYRKKNGKFKRREDLMKVKGIGEKTFKKFEKMLTL